MSEDEYKKYIQILEDDNKRLTRELDEAREQRDKANAIRCKDCEVRKHFRRACEWLGQASGMPNNVEFHPADEWHVRIMVEVNKELNHGST